MKKTIISVAFLFAFFSLDTAEANYSVSCPTQTACNQTQNGYTGDVTFTCTTNCTPTFTNHVGTVTMVLACDVNSPTNFTGVLSVNGVSTPVHSQNCTPVAPVASAGVVATCASPYPYAAINWQLSPGATSYDLTIGTQNPPSNQSAALAVSSSEDAGMSYLVEEYGLAGGNSYTQFEPEPNVNYVVSVVACNAGGCSDATETSFMCAPAASLSVSSCTIADGESDCVGSVGWNTYYVANPLVLLRGDVIYNDVSGAAQALSLEYGTQVVSVNDSANELAVEVVNVSCEPGLFWNTAYCSTVEPEYPPTIEVVPQDEIIRSGSNTEIDIYVGAPYPAFCTIDGGTTPSQIEHEGTPEDDSYTVTTRNLTSAQVFTVTCAPSPALLGTGSTVNETRIEVIPTIQEF